MNTQTVTTMKPEQILADQNIRFGLKKERIASMAESIKERGGVMQSVEIEPLDPPVDGKKFRITDGHYRHAASLLLNDTENAGIELPVKVVAPSSPGDRLRRQVTANLEREDMSPMDKARAIQEALDLNIPMSEIREMFGTPGGRKGVAKQPASNSFINMMVSFLDLPKSVQGKIHSGLVGVASAYTLVKITKDDSLTKDQLKAKQEEVIAECEEDRQKELEKAEKEEEKYLKSQAKTEAQIAKEREAEEKAAKEKEAIELANHAMVTKQREAEEAVQKALETFNAKMEATKAADKDAVKKAEEAHKAADAAAKKAQADFRGAQATHAKMQARLAPKAAEEKPKKGSPTPDIPKSSGKVKPISPTEVAKAAAKVGAATSSTKLNATQMLAVVAELQLPGHAKVKAIGQALEKCFKGEIDTRACYTLIAEATGESTKKKATA